MILIVIISHKRKEKTKKDVYEVISLISIIFSPQPSDNPMVLFEFFCFNSAGKENIPRKSLVGNWREINDILM